MIKRILTVLLLLPAVVFASTDGGIVLDNPNIEAENIPSLQRGAKYYMNYCIGCHSLKFMRYEQIAQGIGLVDADGKVDEAMMAELILDGSAITDQVLSAMPESYAKESFGVVPPDLTLVARSRGVSWLYTYFRSFYVDDERPMGVNNLIFPNVGMPNVFEPMQGIQVPVIKEQAVEKDDGALEDVYEITHLKIEKPGTMTEREFNQMAKDLVTFLHYVGEPHKLDRLRVGVWALLFLFIFLIFAFLLKREYWRDVH